MPKIVVSTELLVRSKKAMNHEPITHNSRGFTLVELLISVAIMSIIAAIGYVTYGQSQVVARDAKRKQDLRAISTALELYRQKNNRYPCINSTNLNWQTTSTGTNWITDVITGTAPCTGTVTELGTDYINKMPKDPSGTNDWTISGSTIQTDLDNATNKKGYAYGFLSTLNTAPCPSVLNGNYYVLITTLENENDAESNKNKSYTWCSGGTNYISHPTTGNKNLFVISSQ